MKMVEDPSTQQPSGVEEEPVKSGTAKRPLGRIASYLRRIHQRDRAWRRSAEVGALVAAVAGVIGAVAAVIVLIPQRKGTDAFTVDVTCLQPDCISSGGKITFQVEVSGSVPDGKRLLLIHKSPADGALSWVLGAVTPDDNMKWTITKTLGNPVPQSKERQFETCAAIMPIADADKLEAKPDQIPLDKLPSSMEKLDCVNP
ncbi:MAG TPA: hypothetical protein VJT72_08150, partial [Pseudonocardiaceae bacterium]|nr:hypothetical protein [Pseudonocardiaceae bacterium]